jgi:hypothetical protein
LDESGQRTGRCQERIIKDQKSKLKKSYIYKQLKIKAMKKANHASIYEAIGAFQRECPTIGKKSEGYGYKYADFTEIVTAIKPLLEKHGLGFIQYINSRTVVTEVFHISEDGKQVNSIQSTTDIPDNVQLKGMNTFQVLGSGISYVKRYALTSILGITTADDNDAAGKEEKPAKKVKLTDARFKNAVKSVQEGEIEASVIIDKFELTEEQTKTLEEL